MSDLVRGVTLADRLESGPLGAREASELLATVADAVQHAHDQGVVHRDLKPSNIMIDAGGRPYVMDFGLAKRESGEVTMTVEGAILGTPAYMSPEQAQGDAHDADARSDVYSLGVILFECLTSELPFRGNKRMLIHQVINDEPPSVRSIDSSVPRDLETIVAVCLEKDPNKRVPSASQLASELRRWLDGRPISTRPISTLERFSRACRRHPRESALLAVVFLSLAIGFSMAVILWRRSDSHFQQSESLRLALRDQNRSLIVGRLSDAADKAYRSDDPKLALLLASEAVDMQLKSGQPVTIDSDENLRRLLATCSTELLKLPGDGWNILGINEDEVFSFSSDSTLMYYMPELFRTDGLANPALLRISSEGVELMPVDDSPGLLQSIIPSAKGAEVYVEYEKGKSYQYVLAGKGRYQQTECNVRREPYVEPFSFEPGIRRVGAKWVWFSQAPGRITLRDLEGASSLVIKLPDGLRGIDDVVVSDNGRWVACSGDGWAGVFDITFPESPVLELGQRVNGDLSPLKFEVNAIQFSKNSAWLGFVDRTHINLHKLDAPDRSLHRLVGGRFRFTGADWVMVEGSSTSSSRQQAGIWRLSNLTGSPIVSFQENQRVFANPSGSVVGVVERGKAWLVDLAFGNGDRPSIIPLEDEGASDLEFSPSGDWIVVRKKEGYSVFRHQDGQTRRMLQANESPLRWALFSPNNSWLAATMSDGNSRLWKLEGDHITPVENQAFSGGRSPFFTADSRWFTADSRWLVVSERGEFQILNLENETSSMISTGLPVTGETAVSSDSSTLAIERAGDIGIWRLDNPHLSAKADYSVSLPARVGSLTPSDDGKLLAVGWSDGKCEVFEMSNGQLQLQRKLVAPGFVRRVEFSPSNKWLSATVGNNAYVHELGAADSVEPIRLPTGGPTGGKGIVFSPCERWAIANAECRLHDLVKGEVRELRGFRSTSDSPEVLAVAFSDDSELLAVAVESEILVWRLDDTGPNNQPIVIKQRSAYVLTFGPDSRRLLASSTATSRCWFISESNELTSTDLVEGPSLFVDRMFSSDGHWLIGNSFAGGVEIWPVETDGEMASKIEIPSAVTISTDGKTLAVAPERIPTVLDLSEQTPESLVELADSQDLRSTRRLYFHPSNRWLIDVDVNEVRVHRVSNGKVMRTISLVSRVDRQSESLQSTRPLFGSPLLGVSRDGRWLVVALENFEALADLGSIAALQFFPFESDSRELVDVAREIAGRQLTKEERERFLLE